MRFFSFVAAAAVSLAAASAAAAAPASVAALERAGQAPPLASTWPATVTARTGEQVRVRVSTAYPAGDLTIPQRFVDALAAMPHGEELTRLTLYLAPRAEVGSVCGGSGVGCYGRQEQAIVLAADSEWPPAEQVLAHEYGHHLANNRRNPPWRAADRGAKYWSTIENVCRRVTLGTYAQPSMWWARQRSPAEGFAEAYRFLVLASRPAWDAFPTTVDDTLFSFRDEVLAAVERDVHTPWPGATRFVLRGSLRSRATSQLRIGTPLDGTVTLRLRGPPGATAALVHPDGYVVRRGRAIAATVCGERSWTVRVTAPRPARFSLVVIRP